MKYHTGLTIERWEKLPFLDRVANVGSEVYRAISSRDKGAFEDSSLAFLRSLELFDITISRNLTGSQLNEICRLREIWKDYFVGDNYYKSDKSFFEKYFNYITVRARAL